MKMNVKYSRNEYYWSFKLVPIGYSKIIASHLNIEFIVRNYYFCFICFQIYTLNKYKEND